jgi:methionine biosynthesis protein MetW
MSAPQLLSANQLAIAALIPAGSRVLDLGCGDGSLLAHLRDVRACRTYGVEIDDANLIACVQKGLNVIQLNLEAGLSMFGDASFDVVLQLDTLPNIRHTEAALRETARVGKLGIISFANFAYWPLRMQVLGGRLPVTKELPYEWYNTQILPRLQQSASCTCAMPLPLTPVSRCGGCPTCAAVRRYLCSVQGTDALKRFAYLYSSCLEHLLITNYQMYSN